MGSGSMHKYNSSLFIIFNTFITYIRQVNNKLLTGQTELQSFRFISSSVYHCRMVEKDKCENICRQKYEYTVKIQLA